MSEQPNSSTLPLAKLKKGDTVTIALHLAGLTTREEATVLANRKGVIAIDNGAGNDPTCFDHEGYHLIGGRDVTPR